MKSKLLIILVFICLCVNINVVAYEADVDESTFSKIYVDYNEVDLEINGNTGEVNIKNNYFNSSYQFECYYLSGAAISYNTIILDSNNSSAEYLGLDFEDNCFNYIVKINDSFLYSSIEFSNLSCDIDLYNTFVKDELINDSIINHSDSPEQYISLKDMAQRAYSFFKVSRNTSNINTRSLQDVNITGNGAFYISPLIETGTLDTAELTTVGISYGMIVSYFNQDQKVDKLYALNTTYDALWDEYYTYMKIWIVTYSNSLNNNGEVTFTVNIIDDCDVLIIWNDNNIEASTAATGYAFFEIENVKFFLLTCEYSYINEFETQFTYEKSDDTIGYLSYIDKLVAAFYDKTAYVYAGLQIIDNIYDHFNQIQYDSSGKKFAIADGNENARMVGFNLNKDDVESGFFIEQKIESYTYKMVYGLSDVTTDTPNLNMNFEIVPLIDTSQTLTYNWNYNSTGKVCNHQKSYTYINSDKHIEACQVCHYKYYQVHSISYTNLGESGHSINCNLCSKTESHSLVFDANRAYCSDCDYVHTHSYSYAYYNSTYHYVTCSCGYHFLEEHFFGLPLNGLSNETYAIIGKLCTRCGVSIM